MIQGNCDWRGDQGHKANECEDEAKFVKEKGWGRQAPSAVAVEQAQQATERNSQRHSPLKAPEWIINMKKFPDIDAKGAGKGAQRMLRGCCEARSKEVQFTIL